MCRARLAHTRPLVKQPEHDVYEPIPRRRRWLILLLGVGTALTITWMLLERPGGLHGPKYVAPVPSVPICAGPMEAGCVGGKAEVIMLPARPAAPASAAAR